MTIKFSKFQGFGNDYLVFEQSDLQKVRSLNEFARRVCDRHYGIGADGIAVFCNADEAETDFAVRIFNPDGSEAGFSGNGTRCAVAHLFYRNIWRRKTVRLRLPSGVKRYLLTEKIADGHYRFEAEIGQPKFMPAQIPITADADLKEIVGFPLKIDNEEIKITAVNVGNPVCTIFVENFDAIDWRKIGDAVENHIAFPERTNVVFGRVTDRKNIEVRIWERGAGETLASGTCTTAAAVCAMRENKLDRRAEVHSVGGTISVEWRTDDNEIVMNGRADFVFSGEWLDE